MSTAAGITLYDYWRSSACYRVRIALNLKKINYTLKPVHLLNNGGEQHTAEHRELNPQEAVPVLVDGSRVIRQSLAIIEYLDEAHSGDSLLPTSARDRAHVRGMALLVACDIHPLNNLRVIKYLEHQLALDQTAREAWMRHWIEEGFRALETMLADDLATGAYCHGEAPTMADACLIPQVYSATRFNVDMTPYPTIVRINEQCLALPAFDAARPEKQPGAQ